MKPFLQPLIPAFSKLLRGVRLLVTAASTVLLLLFVTSFFLDAPLRAYIEKEMNRHLKGYSVRISSLHLQLVGLSVTLKGLSVSQKRDPHHPIAMFPVLRASIHWRALLSRRLVGEFRLERPEIRIDRGQVQAEAVNRIPLREQGWQQAVLTIYPLNVDLLTISDGDIVYRDDGASPPLHLSHLNLEASNIRNVRSPERTYPSSFHLDAVIFGSGRATLDGVGNFLLEPHPGLKTRFDLRSVPIDLIKPIIARAGLALRGGVLGASGDAEYAPTGTRAHVNEITVTGMDLDYVHTPLAARATHANAAKRIRSQKPRRDARGAMALRVDQLRLAGCTVGIIDRTVSRPYRLFVQDADLTASNLTNQAGQGPADFRLGGKFMGSGAVSGAARFHPGERGGNLELKIKIEGTRLAAMNDLLLSYADFDVSGGSFSFYSEVGVHDGKISGYVKPFLKDMQVYDWKKDKGKNLTHQLYKLLISGAAALLENGSGEVATRADISGRLGDPRTSTWQIVGQLLRNAFIKALVPGFTRS